MPEIIAITEIPDALRKVKEAGYTLEELFEQRHSLFSPQELQQIDADCVNGDPWSPEHTELCQYGLATMLVNKQREKYEQAMRRGPLENCDNTFSSSNDEWREKMKKVRVVEFWTGYPNKPAPTIKEKRKALSEYRSWNTAIFERRLGAYHLPKNITDEELIHWDGEPLVK